MSSVVTLQFLSVCYHILRALVTRIACVRAIPSYLHTLLSNEYLLTLQYTRLKYKDLLLELCDPRAGQFVIRSDGHFLCSIDTKT